MTVKRHVSNKATSKDSIVTPKVRFSEGLRQQLRKAADANFRTLNAEITVRLTRSLQHPEPAE
jgi:Arc-like DNA binding domain